MKIRTFSTVEQGVYKVTMNTEDWSERDQRLIADFGEPQVDIGGDFEGPAPDYIEFSLPSDYVNVMTDSPFQQTFDSRDSSSELAQQYAVLWKTTVIDRIAGAVETMRQIEDTFTKEEVAEV